MEQQARETILYEISMAIGTSLSLEAMCRSALEAFTKRLNASSGAILAPLSRDRYSNDLIIASIPRRISEFTSFYDCAMALHSACDKPHYHAHDGEHHYYAFRLADVGYLALRRSEPLGGLIMRSMPALLAKLATSIQACLDNAALHRSLERAQESERAKSAFLANMSHEIRTPMNAILGFLQILSSTEKDSKRKQQLEIVLDSGNNLLTIINDILDLSKIESGEMILECRPFSANALLSEARQLFAITATERNIALVFSGNEDLPQFLLGDSTRLKQVINNLLNNALKFTEPGGTVKVEASYHADNQRLQIVVTDTGIGISEDKLQKIFDDFMQEDDSTTRRFGGTGLGLSISSKLVGMMQGHIEVESTPGSGSRFSFTIAAPEHIERAKKAVLSEHAQANRGAKTHRLLLVEDNQNNRALLASILDARGLTYDTARDGVEALARCAETRYDLILMDESMPRLGGTAALQRLKFSPTSHLNPQTPVIIVTASAMAGDRQRFLDAGADDYISKPYQQQEMLALIDRHLANSAGD